MQDDQKPGSDLTREHVGELLALAVHDLRNPAATVKTNLYFIDEAHEPIDEGELQAALRDTRLAMQELLLALAQYSWIADWYRGRAPARDAAGDPLSSIEASIRMRSDIDVALSVRQAPGLVRGGGSGPGGQVSAVQLLVDVLLANCSLWARGHAVEVVVDRDSSERVTIEVRDPGHPLAPEFREQAFTLAGQLVVKQRRAGRYSRALGLFAAKLLAEAVQAKLEADSDAGQAVFRLTLMPAGDARSQTE